MADRDSARTAVGSDRQRLLVAPFVPPAGAAGGGAAARDSRRRRGSDNDDDGDSDDSADADAGPLVRVPSMVAPSRVMRILWTASEDRVVLTEYVKLAAEAGPHIRLAWKPRASALPYSITICIRHIRYLKRNYPSYTGRLDELLRRAYERKVDLAAARERAEARLAAYQERLRRRRAGEPVRPLGEDGCEVPEESRAAPTRNPLEVTRAIVMADAAAALAAGGVCSGLVEGGGVVVEVEQGEDAEEAALLRRVGEQEQQRADVMVAEREAAVAEAMSLVEDFVLVIPRRSSQQRAELLQQQGGLELGERLEPTATDAQVRRRAAAAARRSLGGTLQPPAAAGDAAAATPTERPVARSRRSVGSGSAAAAAYLAVPPPLPPVARPSVAVTAAMCMLVSLLFQVRAVGGVAGWMSQQVVETLADFGRRFAADIKAAALKQMQLRGWLAPSGPRRQLDLTPAFVNRLQGTELPLGLLGRCATAAGRLDELLAQAAAAAARCARQMYGGDDDEDEDDGVGGGEGMDVDAAASAAPAPAAAEVVADPDRAGAEAVERSCTVDVSRGALALEAQEQLPSELVAVVLARQALGRVELLLGAVDMQPEWAGQAATAGMLLTSVQLLIVPTKAGNATAAAAARAGGAGGSACAAAPPPVVGTRVAVGAPSSTTVPAGDATAGAHRPQMHDTAAAAAHGDGVTAAAVELADSDSGPWPNPGELPAAAAPLFAPSAVARDPAMRAEARAHLAEETASWPAVVAELAEAAEALLEAAGSDGLTFAELSAGLHKAASGGVAPSCTERGGEGGGGATVTPAAGATADAAPAAQADGAVSCDSGGAGGGGAPPPPPLPPLPPTAPLLTVSVPPTQSHVSLVLRALERHGLVRRVGGWDALHFIAVQHCRDAIVEIGAASDTAASDTAAGTAAAADAAPDPDPAAASAAPASPAAPPSVDAEPAGATQGDGSSAAASANADASMEGMDTDAVAVAGATTPAEDAGTGAAATAADATGTPMHTDTGDGAAAAAAAAVAAGTASGAAAAGSGGGGDDAAAAAGTAAAGRERVLRPWLDHRGFVNAKIWDALLQRLLGLVMRHPGIPEELLVASLDVIPPQAVRELLHHLAEHGRVEVRTMTTTTQRPRRPLLLGGGGTGGGGAAGGGGSSAGQAVVHYFPILEQYAGATMLQVPPP